MLNLKKQTGLSLIELLIGVLIGMIVVAIAIKIFTGSAQNGQEMTQNNHLERDLRNMMDRMVHEIKRAGYVNSSADPEPLQNNQFAKLNIEPTPITIKGVTYDYPTGCIVFMYNRDSKNPKTPADDERFGFKLALDKNFSPGKRLLRMWKGDATLTCTTNPAKPAQWETITSPEVEITDLRFDLNETPVAVPPPPSCVSNDIQLVIRTVTITLTGVLRKNGGNGDSIPETEQTITDTVKIRNDMYCHNGIDTINTPIQCKPYIPC